MVLSRARSHVGASGVGARRSRSRGGPRLGVLAAGLVLARARSHVGARGVGARGARRGAMATHGRAAFLEPRPRGGAPGPRAVSPDRARGGRAVEVRVPAG